LEAVPTVTVKKVRLGCPNASVILIPVDAFFKHHVALAQHGSQDQKKSGQFTQSALCSPQFQGHDEPHKGKIV
jgi:hypothetical protein